MIVELSKADKVLSRSRKTMNIESLMKLRGNYFTDTYSSGCVLFQLLTNEVVINE